MIPQFPEFKKIELSDKNEVESFTKKFPPYSDFNFVSMWSWNVRGDIMVCWLNNNLAVRFSDYLNGEPYYAFLGDNDVDETASLLIEISGILQKKPEINLISETVASKLSVEKFLITEEPDQFDYIYDLNILSSMAGGHFASKRTAINKLKREFPTIGTVELDINDEYTKFDIKNINISWTEYKSKNDPYGKVKNELIAIDRFLNGSFFENIITLGVFIDKKMVAYHILEVVQDKYVICHYIKTDFSHDGIYSYLMNETARILISKNLEFFNFEQDLGLPGLKKSKQSFSTGIFFKKYKVMLK